MRIYTSIDSFRDMVTEYKNGEVRNNDYTAEDVLRFIQNESEKLMEFSENGKSTKVFELFKTIYPKMKLNEEILERLFELGGKTFFEELIQYTPLINDDQDKIKIYNVAIRAASKRIDNLDEKIFEERINESESSVIEALESKLIQEEEWKKDLRKQRQEMIPKITEKPEYDSNGFDIKSRTT